MLRRPTLPLPLFRSLAVIFLWCVPVFLIFFLLDFYILLLYLVAALLLSLSLPICACVFLSAFSACFLTAIFFVVWGRMRVRVRVRTLIVCPFPLLDNLHLICLLYARWFYIRLVLIAKNSSTRINRHTHTRTPATACPQHNCVCPPPPPLSFALFHFSLP